MLFFQISVKRNKAKNLWELFQEYHYLDKTINKACCFFVAWWSDVPVGCVAVTGFPGPVRQVERSVMNLFHLRNYAEWPRVAGWLEMNARLMGPGHCNARAPHSRYARLSGQTDIIFGRCAHWQLICRWSPLWSMLIVGQHRKYSLDPEFKIFWLPCRSNWAVVESFSHPVAYCLLMRYICVP
jgi:hypothetical protein